MTVLMEETDYWMIDLYLKKSNERYRTSWEQTRFMSYITAQVQSTKRIKPSDIMDLPWDNEKGKRQNKTQKIDEKKRNELISEMQKTITNYELRNTTENGIKD
jgi:hypothetical protein